MNETRSLTSPIVKALNRIPDVFAYRMNSGSVPTRGGFMHGAPPGTPDVLALVLGHGLFIETKTRSGELTKVQLECHEELRRGGNSVIVVRAVHEATVEATALRARIMARYRSS